MTAKTGTVPRVLALGTYPRRAPRVALWTCPLWTNPKPLAPNPYCLMPAIHEESIKACPERSRRIAGATKAPDYTFRIGGRRGLDLPAARCYIESANAR